MISSSTHWRNSLFSEGLYQSFLQFEGESFNLVEENSSPFGGG